MPVSGAVTLDGVPLANAVVAFAPAGATKGVGAVGRTDAGGKYTLATPHGSPGVVPGEYKVTVSKFVDLKTGADAVLEPGKPPIDQPDIRELLPPQYSNPTMSRLDKTVPPGGGMIDLVLKK
ncbi:MAG: carboxypeptidase-like regulatory domain-containing protein [Gemmataceae bacterium]